MDKLVEILSSLTSIADIKAKLNSLGYYIKFSHDDSRILITHYRSIYNSPLDFMANGIIYDTASKKVIAMPCSQCNIKAKHTDVRKNFSSYKIYPIIDGTMVTLYWYEGSKSENKPGSKSENEPEGNLENKPEGNLGNEPEGKLGNGPGSKSENEPEGNLESKPGSKSEDKPGSKSENKPEGNLENEVKTASTASTNQPTHQSQGNWTLATSNGFNVNDYKWIGPNTYWEEFANLYDCAGLDKTKCYNFIMRTANWHPFNFDKPKITLISSWNLSTFTQEFAQKPVVISFNEIRDNCANSWSEYTKTREYNYGYIFRSDEYIGAITNVRFESSLMRAIRCLMYDFPDKLQLDHTSRLKFMMIMSYLTYNKRCDFLELFPWAVPDFTKYNAFVKTLVTDINHALNSQVGRQVSRQNQLSQQVGQPVSQQGSQPVGSQLSQQGSQYDNFVTMLCHSIRALNLGSIPTNNVIYNHIVDPMYTTYYMDLM